MSMITPIFVARRNLFNYDPLSSLDVWDPFSDHNGSNRIMRSSVGGWVGMEWKETAEAHVLEAELPPGFKKEDVKVSVEEGRILKIRGEKKMEREERGSDQGYYRRSSSRSEFLNQFVLPENARLDHVKTSIENGVIRVTIPKKGVHSNYTTNEHHLRSIDLK